MWVLSIHIADNYHSDDDDDDVMVSTAMVG